MDVLAGIQPDLCGHDTYQHVRGRSERLHANAFVLQVGNSADRIPRKQLLTTDMHAGQNRQRFAGIDRRDKSGRTVQAEVDLAGGDFPQSNRGSIDIADIGETLCAQQSLGDVLRGDADTAVRQPHRGRFEKPVRGEGLLPFDEVGGPSQ